MVLEPNAKVETPSLERVLHLTGDLMSLSPSDPQNFLFTFFFFEASEYSEGSSHRIFPVGLVEPSHFG